MTAVHQVVTLTLPPFRLERVASAMLRGSSGPKGFCRGCGAVTSSSALTRCPECQSATARPVSAKQAAKDAKAALWEDVLWLVECGELPEGVCRRTGSTAGAVAAMLRRHGYVVEARPFENLDRRGAANAQGPAQAVE